MIEEKQKIVQRVAMKAVIVRGGKVLLLREARTYKDGTNHGRYHFPGGRIQPGENFEEALKREVVEETGLRVELAMPIYVGEWSPIIRGVQNHIVAVFILCKASSDDIKLSDEHDGYKWVEPSERSKLDVMYPDRVVVDKYAELNKKGLL